MDDREFEKILASAEQLRCKRPILTYPTGKAPLGSFPLKVFKNRT